MLLFTNSKFKKIIQGTACRYQLKTNIFLSLGVPAWIRQASLHLSPTVLANLTNKTQLEKRDLPGPLQEPKKPMYLRDYHLWWAKFSANPHKLNSMKDHWLRKTNLWASILETDFLKRHRNKAVRKCLKTYYFLPKKRLN